MIFLLIRYSVGHTIDFTRGLQQIVNALQEKNTEQEIGDVGGPASRNWSTAPEIQGLMQEDKTPTHYPRCFKIWRLYFVPI